LKIKEFGDFVIRKWGIDPSQEFTLKLVNVFGMTEEKAASLSSGLPYLSYNKR
jgi:hypothetical protein